MQCNIVTIRKCLCIVLVVTFILPSSLSLATVMLMADIDQLTEHSSLVVLGKVKGIESYWNVEHSMIFTDVSFEVTSTFKGSADKFIVVQLYGGTVGDTTTTIVDGPTFSVGEEALLFLHDYRAKKYRLTGLSQGKFDVRLDGKGEKIAVSNAAKSAHLLSESGERTSPPGGKEGLPLKQILDKVRGKSNFE